MVRGTFIIKAIWLNVHCFLQQKRSVDIREGGAQFTKEWQEFYGLFVNRDNVDVDKIPAFSLTQS